MNTLRFAAVLCAVLAAPLLAKAQREKLPPDDLDYVEQTWPNAKKTSAGIRYIVEKSGSGPLLQPGHGLPLALVEARGEADTLNKIGDKG